MTVLATYTLSVHSLHEVDDRELPVVTSISNWKGYLLEAAENLSDVLPPGYYVTIENQNQEGEDDA